MSDMKRKEELNKTQESESLLHKGNGSTRVPEEAVKIKESRSELILNKVEIDIDSTDNLTKFGIWKNLLILSISFMLSFTAFSSFANLQSTINIVGGLGTTGLSLIYATMVLTNLIVTPLTSSRFSYKRIMAGSLTTYMVYIATGFYSSWATVIPASLIIGFGAAHLWPAQQAYLVDLAKIHARLTKGDANHSLTLFTGIFYGFMKSSHIWGNLVASLILDRRALNFTADTNLCGQRFCPYVKQAGNNIVQPSNLQINIYTSICVGITGLGIVLLAASLTGIGSRIERNVEVLKNIQKVGRLILRSNDQHLLVFTSLLCGALITFVTGDFTLAFVSCAYGVGSLGYAMITFGITMSLGSVVFGKLSKFTGTYVIFLLAFAIQLGASTIMIIWTPKEDEYIVVLVLAGSFGICCAVYEPLLSVIYSTYFVNQVDEALSSFRLVSSLALAATFGYSNWLCMKYKIYISIALTVLSLFSMTVLQIKHRHRDVLCPKCLKSS